MWNRIIIIFLVFLSLSLSSEARYMFREAVYQEAWCKKHNGILEYQLNDKARVDCLTKKYAVEVDFAQKWAECIGQSLYYGISTKRKPAALLIMENGEKDIKYLKRLQKVAKKHHIKIFTITPQDLTTD